nr:MAG TPA: AmiB activator [Herelleviridae sp.]
MRKSVWFLLSVCFFLFPAAAQEPEYVITETELTQLEKISESLQISRQNLQSQANALTERLKAQELKASGLAMSLRQAESTAKSLSGQLQTERKSLKHLRQSYNAYEREAAQQITTLQAVIDKQKDKLHRRMITIIILSAVLLIIGVIIGMKYFLKSKFSLFRSS